MAERIDPTQSLTPVLARVGSEDASRTGQSVSSRSLVSSWEQFSHWLCAVCVVTFDLELGQALEVGTLWGVIV